MGKFVDKVLGVLGFEFDQNASSLEEEREWTETETPKRSRKSNLLSLPTQRSIKMVLVKPRSYEEAEPIGEHIRERRSVIVNLDEVEKVVAQRIVDFLSGAVFAVEGSVQKVSADTFLFAGNNIDISGQIMDIEREKSLFRWASRAKS